MTIKKVQYIFPILFFAVILTGGCASSGGTGQPGGQNERVTNNSRIEVRNPTTSLADYLRRVPGVYVRGSGNEVEVVIQGINTFLGDTSPLFVIDQVRVGRSYSQVAGLINMHDIDHIEVLKGVNASAYGVEGGNGVILINTRKSR